MHSILFIENKFLFPIDRFRIYRLKSFILKGNRKINKEAYKKKLELEYVIEMEEKMDSI